MINSKGDRESPWNIPLYMLTEASFFPANSNVVFHFLILYFKFTALSVTPPPLISSSPKLKNVVLLQCGTSFGPVVFPFVLSFVSTQSFQGTSSLLCLLSPGTHSDSLFCRLVRFFIQNPCTASGSVAFQFGYFAIAFLNIWLVIVTTCPSILLIC